MSPREKTRDRDQRSALERRVAALEAAVSRLAYELGICPVHGRVVDEKDAAS